MVDEKQRVIDFLVEITKGQVGVGEDPVGFILASHALLAHQRNQLRLENESLSFMLSQFKDVLENYLIQDAMMKRKTENTTRALKLITEYVKEIKDA